MGIDHYFDDQRRHAEERWRSVFEEKYGLQFPPSNPTRELLHERFNPRSDQIPPVRIKGLTRAKLAELFAELKFVNGAEVGVAEGIFSLVLCQTIPNLKLRCVDLWDTYYRGRTKLKNKAEQDEALARAHEKLDSYSVTFMRGPAERLANDVPDESLDFVYLDGDHSFDHIMLDLILWSRKVRKGGIVSGHDYYRFRGAGVVDAVNAYTHAHQVYEWFLDDQRETTFFWAKP